MNVKQFRVLVSYEGKTLAVYPPQGATVGYPSQAGPNLRIFL